MWICTNNPMATRDIWDNFSRNLLNEKFREHSEGNLILLIKQCLLLKYTETLKKKYWCTRIFFISLLQKIFNTYIHSAISNCNIQYLDIQTRKISVIYTIDIVLLDFNLFYQTKSILYHYTRFLIYKKPV